jgi:predicted lipoprotein with Yx(FWY)xxD motif
MENSQPTPRSRPRRRPRPAYFATALGAGAFGLAAALAVMGGPASATGAVKATTATKVAVDEVSVAKYDKVLVDQKGLALYYDTANKPMHFACTGACLSAWPPLVLAKGQTAALAGPGVTGLGTVRGPSGLQVTWQGKALYTFVEDTKGTVTGQGIGHVWFVTQPSAAITKAPAATTKAPAPGAAAPSTTAPSTTAPSTMVTPTTAPSTTAPSTTAPSTMVTPTTAPSTSSSWG